MKTSLVKMNCEFDITIVAPKGILNQALADLLAQFSSGDHKQLHEVLPYEETCFMRPKNDAMLSMAPPLITVGGKD